MSRRVGAVAVTVFAVIVAGALRTPGDAPAHEHGAGTGPLGAMVALVMMVVAAALLVAMLRGPRQPAPVSPEPAPRR